MDNQLKMKEIIDLLSISHTQQASLFEFDI